MPSPAKLLAPPLLALLLAALPLSAARTAPQVPVLPIPPAAPAAVRVYEIAFDQLPTPDDGGDKTPKRKNLLIIGASSLISPLGQPQLVGALLESKGTPMNVAGKFFGTESLDRMLRSRKAWDYVVMDAWQFRRGGTDAPGFPDAVAAFAKQVRAHSPRCQIILFTWWIPRGPDATPEGGLQVFRRCAAVARQHGLWVATTGPAFMEARRARPGLQVTVSAQDAHPGIHGAYLNACSLFAILTGESPVGLPATLKLPGRDQDLAIAPGDATYLQELAWKVYQRERAHTKPAKQEQRPAAPARAGAARAVRGLRRAGAGRVAGFPAEPGAAPGPARMTAFRAA